MAETRPTTGGSGPSTAPWPPPSRRPPPGPLRDLRLLARLSLLSLQGAMEYRASFLMQAGFMMVNNLVFLGFWWLFFDRFDRVAGWGLEDVLVLYGMVAGAFGLAHTVLGNLRGLATMIVEGQLDRALSQPRDPLIWALATRASPAAVGDLVFGVSLFVAVGARGPGDVLWFCALMSGGALVYASFEVIAGCSAFWVAGTGKLASTAAESLLIFSMYPDALFTGGVRLLLFTLVPAGFVSYLPVRMLRAPSGPDLALWLAGILFSLWAARRVFDAGLRRYESGNQMVANV